MYVIVFFFLHKMLASHRQPTFRDRYHEWWYATCYLSITSWDVSGVFFLRLWTCCCLNNNVKRSNWAFGKVVLTEAPMPIRKLLEKQNDEWYLSIAILFLDCHTVYFCIIYFIFEVFQNFARAQSGLSTRPMSWAFSISSMAWVPTERCFTICNLARLGLVFRENQPLENRKIFMKKCYENPWKLRNPSRNRMFVMEKGYRMLVYWSVYDIYHGLIIWFVLNVMMKCSGHTSDKGGFHTHFAQQSRAKCSEGTHFEGFLEQANFPLRKSAEDIGFMVHFSLYSILDFCGLIRQWFLFQIISEDWRMGSGCLCGSDFSDLLIADGKQHGGKNARCVKVFHFRKPGSSVGLESHFFNMTLQEYNISIWIDLEENCPTFFLGVHFLSRKSACRRCVFLGQVPLPLLSWCLDPQKLHVLWAHETSFGALNGKLWKLLFFLGGFGVCRQTLPQMWEWDVCWTIRDTVQQEKSLQIIDV